MNKVEVDGSNTVFGTDVLRVAAGGSVGETQDALKSKGLTFEIKLVSDNSVVIADSLEVHGVTEITGNGERFSCVAYMDSRLATKGVAGKSEKLIGKYAKKQRDEFGKQITTLYISLGILFVFCLLYTSDAADE